MGTGPAAFSSGPGPLWPDPERTLNPESAASLNPDREAGFTGDASDIGAELVTGSGPPSFRSLVRP